MSRFKDFNKDEAIAAFEQGMTANELTKAGFTKGSVYKWQQQWKAEQRSVEEAEVPPAIKSPTDPPETRPSSRSKGISEETAGHLLTMGFGLWAAIKKNDLCYLTDAEKKTLQSPFAQTLRVVPNPIADLMNTYAPPVTFVTLLFEVVSKKNEQMEAEDRKQWDELEQRKVATETIAGPHTQSEQATNGVPPVKDAAGKVSRGVPEPEAPSFRFGG